MTKVRISVNIDSNLHLKLKMDAFRLGISLNDLCNELITHGHGHSDTIADHQSKNLPSLENENIRNLMIKKILLHHDSDQIMTVLCADAFKPQWIAIYGHSSKLQMTLERIDPASEQSVLKLQWPHEEWPTKPYWIEISKSAEVIWAKTEEIGNEIQSKLKRWSVI
jgi:hypothetical protein